MLSWASFDLNGEFEENAMNFKTEDVKLATKIIMKFVELRNNLNIKYMQNLVQCFPDVEYRERIAEYVVQQNFVMKNICSICGKEFTPKGARKYTCRRECSIKRMRVKTSEWIKKNGHYTYERKLK